MVYTVTCAECGKDFSTHRSTQGYCSKACQQASHKGLFAKTRKQALARDGHACTLCGECHGLEVHHIQPRSKGGSHTLENLITYCKYHHLLAHNKRPKEVRIYARPAINPAAVTTAI